MTYSIRVRERDGKSEVELCRVESNPDAVVKAAQQKRLLIDTGRSRKVSVAKYEYVHVVELK